MRYEQLRVSRANHADAEPNKIGSARVFDGVKCHGGSGKDRGDAQRGGKDMEESTNKSAERRKDAFATASGKAAGQNIKDPGPGVTARSTAAAKKSKKRCASNMRGL